MPILFGVGFFLGIVIFCCSYKIGEKGWMLRGPLVETSCDTSDIATQSRLMGAPLGGTTVVGNPSYSHTYLTLFCWVEC